jgi:hypothetical protein
VGIELLDQRWVADDVDQRWAADVLDELSRDQSC